jgi:uncharacterized protein YjbI with pentapeptide repeats
MNPSELLSRYEAGERNFRGADLRDADLSGADLSGADLRRANLRETCLHEAILTKAILYQANLTKVDITSAKLVSTNLEGATLINAKLTFADLTEANLEEADLTDAKLTSSVLYRANLLKAQLSSADIQGANLTLAFLHSANLNEANLCEAKMLLATLFNGNLTKAKLQRANLKGANLIKATISEADLSDANLTYSNLALAQLNNAKLNNTDFSGANLAEADLTDTDLTSANLNGTILSTVVNHSLYDMQWTVPLKSLQIDFIQRLKSNFLLHSEIEGQHSDLTVISGQRLKQVIDFSWKMADKYKKNNIVRDVFMKNLKGKLGEEVVKIRLANLVTEVDYEQKISGDGKVDFFMTSNPKMGIQVKTRYCSIDTVQWSIKSEEIKKNAVLVCILSQQEFNDTQHEHHLILAGFLPTSLICKDGDEVGINQLLYAGGLRSYLEFIAKR